MSKTKVEEILEKTEKKDEQNSERNKERVEALKVLLIGIEKDILELQDSVIKGTAEAKASINNARNHVQSINRTADYELGVGELWQSIHYLCELTALLEDFTWKSIGIQGGNMDQSVQPLPAGY